jgi:predicted amidohydrolase
MNTLKVAVLQMNSTHNVEKNHEEAKAMIKKAASVGAEFIALPEVWNNRVQSRKEVRSEPIDGPSITLLKTLAKHYKVSISAGSVCETIPKSNKVYNTSVLINSLGETSAVYRKIHLFDANVGKASIRESESYDSGNEAVMATLGDLNVGLSICYDLRFPYIYQRYALSGAHIITVPSSFTHPTGEKHWEVLLRARAIETQSFIVAANQCGVGAGGIPSYGNSMIISPEGIVLSRASDKVEIITADCDLNLVTAIKNRMPLNNHRRHHPPFVY